MKPSARQTHEIFDMFLLQDMPSPFSEVLMIAAVALPIVSISLGRVDSTGSAVAVVQLIAVTSFLSGTLFTFLVIKNMSFGICQALHSGEWAVYLSYPISRPKLFLLRLASAFAFPAALYLAAILAGLWAAVPVLLWSEPGLVALGLLGTLQPMLLIGSSMSLLSLKLRDGSSALFAGLIIYVVYQALAQISTLAAATSPAAWNLNLRGILQPTSVLFEYARSGDPSLLPAFAGFLAIGLALSFALLVAATRTFSSKSPV